MNTSARHPPTAAPDFASPPMAETVSHSASGGAAAVFSGATDDAVRALLVTGAGKRFCAGGDVASMVASGASSRPVNSTGSPDFAAPPAAG